ncbi:MAG TPA: SDR family NAD(P)-dependent oxidoreductase [Herpetosiphonaceae bacterium]
MSASAFSTRYGPWAVITGAARSQGLGAQFAHELAARGLNLVLIDILAEELQSTAARIQATYGVEVKPVVLDLSRRDFLPELAAITDPLDVHLLICNHFFTPKNPEPFLDSDLSIHQQMLDVNARAYMTLTHYFGRLMRDQRRGGIILVGSGAGLVSSPYTAGYSANKAYQLTLGEALWYELRQAQVDVLVIPAPLMKTQAGLDKFPKPLMMDPRKVAREALAALGKRHWVIVGLTTRLLLFFQTRILPRQRSIRMSGDFMRKGLGIKD